MRHELVLSPLLWQWLVVFAFSMGMAVSLAISLATGLLIADWLFEATGKLRSRPTPQSFGAAVANLLLMGVAVAAAAAAVIASILVFYGLSSLLWPLVTAFSPDTSMELPFEWTDETTGSIITFVLLIAAVCFLIIGLVFLMLRSQARYLEAENLAEGIVARLFVRYFYNRAPTGFLLLLTAWPVLVYCAYDLFLFSMISPDIRAAVGRVRLPGAEDTYARLLSVLGGWMLYVLLLPAGVLWLGAVAMRARYTIENPVLNLMFRRSLKLSALGLLLVTGMSLLGWWADFVSRFLEASGA